MNLSFVNNKRLIRYELFLLLMLGFAQIAEMSALKLVISGLIAILVIVGDINRDAVLLFTAIPFFNLFNKDIGSTSLYYLYIIIFLVKYARYKVIGSSAQKKLIVFFILAVLRVACNNMEVFLKWLMMFAMFIVTYNEEFFAAQIKEITKGITLSMIMSSAFGYYMLQKGTSIYTKGYVYMHGGSTARFAGLVGDSVFFTQFIAVIVALNLIIAFYDRKALLHNLITCIVLTVFSVLSYAKTGLGLLAMDYVIFIMCTILANTRSSNTIIFSFAILIITVIGVFVGYKMVMKYSSGNFIENYFTRFQAEDLTTGRGDIAEYYLNLIKNDAKSWFMAMSFDKFKSGFVLTNGRRVSSPHNIYIETVLTFGLVATVCIMIWLIYSVINAIRNKLSLIRLTPLLCLIVSGFVLHGHREWHYYALVALAFVAISPKVNDVLYNGD